MNNNYISNFKCVTKFFFVLLFSIISLQTQATDYFVDDSAIDNSSDCLTAITACKTIYFGVGSAVSKASSGDTINIAAGTYPEAITVGTKSLTFIGEDPSNTIIDSTGLGTSFSFSGAYSYSISNLTIANANNYSIRTNSIGVELIVRNVRIINNGDSGIFSSDGSVDLKNVELSGNGKQGIHLNPNVTTVSIVNTTISGNVDQGIGAATGAAFTIINSTITNNGKSGIGLNASVANIRNTIIAGNRTDLITTSECFGTAITSDGNNISSDDTCSFDHIDDLEDTNPMLGTLNFNGASTKTHALLDASPAIDTGTNTNCPADDQRGETRPVDGDSDEIATCDIGAYEYTPSGGFNVIKSQNNNVIVVPL